MKCILMNKNTHVLLAEYDSANSVFSKVYQVYNIDYAPYILKSFYKENDLNKFNITDRLQTLDAKTLG